MKTSLQVPDQFMETEAELHAEETRKAVETATRTTEGPKGKQQELKKTDEMPTEHPAK